MSINLQKCARSSLLLCVQQWRRRGSLCCLFRSVYPAAVLLKYQLTLTTLAAR
jgi:hypothetical protein